MRLRDPVIWCSLGWQAGATCRQIPLRGTTGPPSCAAPQAMAGQVEEEILQIGDRTCMPVSGTPRLSSRGSKSATSGQLSSTCSPSGRRIAETGEGRVSRKAHQHTVKMLGQQGDRGIQAEQMAVIDDGNLIAQLLGLVHVMGRKHHRLALRLDRLDALPEVVTGLGSRPVVGSSRNSSSGSPSSASSSRCR